MNMIKNKVATDQEGMSYLKDFENKEEDVHQVKPDVNPAKYDLDATLIDLQARGLISTKARDILKQKINSIAA